MITKDNVPVGINAVVYFMVTKPEDAVLKIQDFTYAVTQYAQTALRDVIGGVELDSLLVDRQKIADEIKKYGGFVPGIRPGKSTAEYLNFVLTRITLPGAIFLGLIALLPSIVQGFSGINTLAMGGTGILIVVSVVLETIKKIESQLVMRNYDKFIK